MSKKQHVERDAAFAAFISKHNGTTMDPAKAFNAGWSARKQVEYQKFMHGPRTLTPLEKLAAEVAIVAPETRGVWSSTARVHWAIIEALREAFIRRGYDWREGRREYLRARAGK